jgi:N,N'-diacetyllegionaminate synthase
MLGPVNKRQESRDSEVRQLCRQSVCAACDLTAGQVLTRDDLTIRRPGTGIPAGDLTRVLGQRLLHDVFAGHLVMRDALIELAVAG